MAEILDLCIEPQSKTHVMYKINLSWQMLQKYLAHLQSLGFLEIHSSSRKYTTTQKGLQFVSKWKDVIDLLLPTLV
jgi:predicted transcriptional regulator